MKNNNSGMTLVELVLGILILGIATTFLVQSFTSALNVINKATRYKNAAAIAQTMIELQDATYGLSKQVDPNISVQYKKNDKLSSESNITVTANNTAQITVKYKKSGSEAVKSFNMQGDIIKANDTKTTNVAYREFLPGNYYFIP